MELNKILNLDKLKLEILWDNNQTKEEIILQNLENGSCGSRWEQEFVKDKISTAILFVKKALVNKQ